MTKLDRENPRLGSGVAPPALRPAMGPSRVWGLGPRDLHAAWWATRGVQVVERGVSKPIQRRADLYLLAEPGQMVRFDMRPMLEPLIWSGRSIVRVRVMEPVSDAYGERVITDADGRVIRVERRYRARLRGCPRVLLTQDRGLAAAWAAAADRRTAWNAARSRTPWRLVETERVRGSLAWDDEPPTVNRFVQGLAEAWPNPGRGIGGIEHHGDGVWTPMGEAPPSDSIFAGPVWIGSTRLPEGTVQVGPAVIGDTGVPSLPAFVRRIADIEPGAPDREPPVRDERGGSRPVTDGMKRAFDVVAASIALILLAPVFLAVAVVIVIEDGWPVFYAQRRECRGGRQFNCWKFRSMFNGAEAKAREFQASNLSDGPHVNIKNDPRVTRIGRIIRKLQIDEFPQLWNVVIGDMSLVGPRPSPERENQFCPAWRERRLSVRPGITGLWQVSRTRREGEDFQEWIRFDLEYVERRSFLLDLKIIFLTVWMLVRGRSSTATGA